MWIAQQLRRSNLVAFNDEDLIGNAVLAEFVADQACAVGRGADEDVMAIGDYGRRCRQELSHRAAARASGI